ncbi:MAG: helix-turn-helix domain-containing protein [Microcoleus sp.]
MPQPKRSIAQMIGCTRLVYNGALRVPTEAW